MARFFPGMLSSLPYRYGANSGVQQYSRTPFRRRSMGPQEVLQLESKDSRGSGERDAGIQVITEVHVSVENGDAMRRDSKGEKIGISAGV